MKGISNALKAHLAGGVTTLASCWLIERTDGQQFAYTTLDSNVTVDGVTFLSAHSFNRTAIVAHSTVEVDNLEVLGFFAADGINEQDLRNGLFNFSTIFVFMINWADLSQGILKLRRGWIGECTANTDGSFSTELRGLTYALVQEFANVFSPLCRADLGDAKCKIPIAPVAWTPNTVYPVGAFVSPAVKDTDELLIAIFTTITGGTSGSTEPTWDTTVGDTTADNDITWGSMLPWRLKASVTEAIDKRSFVVSPLTLRGNGTHTTTASILIRNNLLANTAIEIDDGVNPSPINVIFHFDTSGTLATDTIVTAINARTDTGIRITGLGGTPTISLENISGGQANITVTGDRANPSAFVIDNFTEGWLDGGVVTFLTGQNAGASMEMKTYTATGSTIVTWISLAFPPQPGDTFLYYPGCDKTRSACNDKFNNILNMRAEPDMPGLDRALAYPQTG